MCIRDSYQPGSVRDDFDFGPLLIFNRTEFILASLQMTEEREYAALYELRLLLKMCIRDRANPPTAKAKPPSRAPNCIGEKKNKLANKEVN